MPKFARCFAPSFLLVFVSAMAHAQSATLPAQTTVSSVSTWPTANLLKHNDKAEVTTFDMPGVPFPCRVQNVTVDKLVCGKTRGRQMVAFDRKSVQSIAVDGHARHKASLLFYASAAGLLVGGLSCAASAGESKLCGGLLIAGLASLVSGQVAEHSERYLGPTDARTIYIAPITAPAAKGIQSPNAAVDTRSSQPEAALSDTTND